MNILRRNKQTTKFDPNKIANALNKAFVATKGAEWDNTPTNTVLQTLTDAVVGIIKAAPEALDIERVQDVVESVLMSTGHHDVARAYVVYRHERQQLRAKQDTQAATIHVQYPIQLRVLDTEHLRALVKEACRGLEHNCSADIVVDSIIQTLYDGVTVAELRKAVIMGARSHLEQDPDYGRVTARLVLNDLRLEVLGVETSHSEMQTRYAENFPTYVQQGIDAELLNPELIAKFDLVKLAAALDYTRDFQFTYLGLQTLYDRYFLHIEGRRIELPQTFFMRVAMGLSLLETNPTESAIKFYDVLSSFDFMSSTPTLFNSGTMHSQMSSCYLTTVPDDLAGIFYALKDNALLSKFAGGLGNDWTPVRGMGSWIKGTNGKSQGVIPFLKIVNDTAVAVNQCFAGHTRVFTQDGLKRIDELVEGDLVITQTGAFSPIAQVLAYEQNSKPMVSIKTRHVYAPLDVTDEHPIWACKPDESEPDYYPANEIQVGWFVGRRIANETCEGNSITSYSSTQSSEAAVAILTKYRNPEHSIPTDSLIPTQQTMRNYHVVLDSKDTLAELEYLVLRATPTGVVEVLREENGNFLIGLNEATLKNGSFVRNEFLYSIVTDVVPREPDAVVYDLRIEGDPSYMTETALVHNGGKRKGAVCAYLETWHLDIEEFVELRKNTGDERRRTHDMNSANWIPDLFMERVETNGSWTLFSPSDVPDLHDLYGNAFKARYEYYEAAAARGEIKVFKTVPAVVLWRKMLTMLFETGHPWVTFKDPCNIRSPQSHVGVVHSSNLCFTGDTMVATADGSNAMSIKNLADYSQGVNKFSVYSARNDKSEHSNLSWEDEVKNAVAFKTGTRPVIEVTLSNGDTFRCTPEHELATFDGTWVQAKDALGVELQSTFTFSSKNPKAPGRHWGVLPLEPFVQDDVERIEYINTNFFEADDFTRKHKGLTVAFITEAGVEDVYDLTVEDNHNFYILTSTTDADYQNAQGILVHNCTEITLNTSADEIAVCNLGSVNLMRHLINGALDHIKLRKTIHTAMRMLDNVIDLNFYPVDKAANANYRHRPVGMGIMGFQDCLLEMGIPYASQQAVEWADQAMEIVAYYAYEASNALAQERGTYSSYEGSTWSRGLLPQDTIRLLADARMLGHLECDLSSQLDWTSLRANIALYGMRNSNCLAIAPTATISNIVGVDASIEPIYQNLFVKSNLSGEFTVINEHLVRDLKALGLWDAKMIADLKANDGSVQQISRVPDDLKRLYATAFEMDPTWLVEAAARRQKWIDQAQSLNIYMANANGKRLDQLYRLAWRRGLKTTYYLRTLAASAAEKSTGTGGELQAVLNTMPATEAKFCSIDNPDCESCQ